MAERVVRELVADDQRELVVALGEADHPGVDADVVAVGEGVDVVVGDRDHAVVAGRDRRDVHHARATRSRSMPSRIGPLPCCAIRATTSARPCARAGRRRSRSRRAARAPPARRADPARAARCAASRRRPAPTSRPVAAPRRSSSVVRDRHPDERRDVVAAQLRTGDADARRDRVDARLPPHQLGEREGALPLALRGDRLRLRVRRLRAACRSRSRVRAPPRCTPAREAKRRTATSAVALMIRCHATASLEAAQSGAAHRPAGALPATPRRLGAVAERGERPGEPMPARLRRGSAAARRVRTTPVPSPRWAASRCSSVSSRGDEIRRVRARPRDPRRDTATPRSRSGFAAPRSRTPTPSRVASTSQRVSVVVTVLLRHDVRHVLLRDRASRSDRCDRSRGDPRRSRAGRGRAIRDARSDPAARSTTPTRGTSLHAAGTSIVSTTCSAPDGVDRRDPRDAARAAIASAPTSSAIEMRRAASRRARASSARSVARRSRRSSPSTAARSRGRPADVAHPALLQAVVVGRRAPERRVGTVDQDRVDRPTRSDAIVAASRSTTQLRRARRARRTAPLDLLDRRAPCATRCGARLRRRLPAIGRERRAAAPPTRPRAPRGAHARLAALREGEDEHALLPGFERAVASAGRAARRARAAPASESRSAPRCTTRPSTCTSKRAARSPRSVNQRRFSISTRPRRASHRAHAHRLRERLQLLQRRMRRAIRRDEAVAAEVRVVHASRRSRRRRPSRSGRPAPRGGCRDRTHSQMKPPCRPRSRSKAAK